MDGDEGDSWVWYGCSALGILMIMYVIMYVT